MIIEADVEDGEECAQISTNDIVYICEDDPYDINKDYLNESFQRMHIVNEENK